MQMMIDLDRVLPNPWQPREDEDPEKIRVLAESIASHGMLQLPVGRLFRHEDNSAACLDEVDELHNFGLQKAGIKLQLAFGHSRLAAYKYLRTHGIAGQNGSRPGQWDQIPVILQDLDDEAMFRMGVTENMARNDLNPIEVARSMERYRLDFGKTSEQIGALFGMSDSAVRNKIRLLRLPASVQDKLKKGEISEGTARALVALYEVDFLVRTTAEDSDGLKPSEILEAALSGMAPANVSSLVQRFVKTAEEKKNQPALPFDLEENAPGDLPEEDVYLYEQQLEGLDADVNNFLEGRDSFVSSDMQKALSVSYSEVMRIAQALVQEDLFFMAEDGCTFYRADPEVDPQKLTLELEKYLSGQKFITAAQLRRDLRIAYAEAARMIQELQAGKRLESPVGGVYKVIAPVQADDSYLPASNPQESSTKSPRIFDFDEQDCVQIIQEDEPELEAEEKSWEQSTITITLTYQPFTGTPAERFVTITAQKNNEEPLRNVCTEMELVLPAILDRMYLKLAGIEVLETHPTPPRPSPKS
jgi:ParB-like chromosome segregation protein Spo0J